MTAVDYACGPGHYIIPMAEKVGPDGRVYAVDIQPLTMESVQKKAARKGLKNITTVLVDSYDTGLPAAVADIVVFLDAFHMVAEPEALLREIHRLLKPQGLLFMDPGHLAQLAAGETRI
jgi:ubiquinone/menaquinone biosynthesis C-methylase UbiE